MNEKIKLMRVEIGKNRNKEKTFYPLIPEQTLGNENVLIKRVCLSDSILGCINAMPTSISQFEDYGQFYITVWSGVFKKNDPLLIDYKSLYESDYVQDALLTHEYWYLGEKTLKGEHYNVEGVCEGNRKRYFVISNKYREHVAEILIRNGGNPIEIANIDTCSLMNDYVPRKMKEKMDTIFGEIETIASIEDEDDEIEIEELKNVGTKSVKIKIPDFDIVTHYRNLIIEKIDDYYI